jgi:transglutaminase-like putative cysteine protease
MRFSRLYRVSFYLMLFMATLTMCVDDTDNRYAFLFPLGVAVAGVAASLTVDRNPRLGLERPTANILAAGSVALTAIEYALNGHQILMSLAHLLVYLQLVKMFLPKTSVDDWSLFMLSLIQVLVGAVVSHSNQVGICLFTWALLSIWVLALFSLHRDAVRFRAQDTSMLPNRLDDELYPRLLDVSFVFSAFRVMILTLALGGAIFLVMPRGNASGRSARDGDVVRHHLTGFDEQVKLGQFGEILEDDSIVMSVELFDANTGVRIRPGEELLWRGVTMVDYHDGQWSRQRRRGTSSMQFYRRKRNQSARLRQMIKLESNDSSVLFCLRPVLEATGPNKNEPELNPFDGTFTRPDARSGSYDYVIVSDADRSRPQPGEDAPTKPDRESLLELPDGLRETLRTIAQPLVAEIHADQTTGRARALEAYLRDSGKFSYSLKMSRSNPTLDPVEDFLVNGKEGHCEYFASALTLMLRSIDIPARMVNGFKGADWNDLAQLMSVRQKHAHSWVEAYLGTDEEGSPLWLTLDPTPANERKRSVDQVGGVSANFRQFSDLVRYAWVFFVVGYNADRQNRFLYQPIRNLIRDARSGFRMMAQAAKPTLANLFIFKSFGQFVSVRGFIVAFSALLMVAGLLRGAFWVIRACVRWLRGPTGESSSLAAGVVFYRRLAQLLAEFGLERPPAETQHEFARRATVFLARYGTSTESVAEVPRQVVEAFYRVRFGHLELSPVALASLETRLDALEQSLRATQS